MYTQCPECQIAFRVTAQVLQQAGGKVRCGGCGNAFSALDHLSEDMPKPVLDESSAEPSGDEIEETSRRLLETLNQLAGPDDVHIEDTGVEWRVLDEAEVAKREHGMLDASDTGSMQVDEDAFENDDIPEITDEVSAESETPDHAERRYDDNTPLPDDFDDEDVAEYVPPPVPQRREDDFQQDSAGLEEMQSDLALSEPEEWSDILDEVEPATAPAVAENKGQPEAIATPDDEVSASSESGLVPEPEPAPKPELEPESESKEPVSIEEELADIQSQLTSRDAAGNIISHGLNVPGEHDAVPSDIDTQFELQAEALGLPGAPKGANPAEALSEDERGAQGERHENTATGSESDESTQLAGDDELSYASADENDDDTDVDTTDANTEEAESDLAAVSAALGEGDELQIDDEQSSYEAASGETADDEFSSDHETYDAGPPTGESSDDASHDNNESLDVEDVELEFEETELADLIDDVERIAAEEVDDPVIDIDTGVHANVAQEAGVKEVDDSQIDDETEHQGAAESTDAVLESSMFGQDSAGKYFDDNAAHIESIIMEGEVVRNALEQEEQNAREAERLRTETIISESDKLADTYALNRDKIRGGRRSYDPPGRVAILGIAALAILLVAQIVHAMRESLATTELFTKTIAPVYRVLGQPVTPAWNIKGWRFEGTNGSTNEDESVLTVVSRIGNQADGPLPYPLIHVALTDRWEEIIGSRVLEPNEYLAGDLDPSRPVTAGDTFTAVISIENPSTDATGFKLNVCYRVESGRVRCAIEDFK